MTWLGMIEDGLNWTIFVLMLSIAIYAGWQVIKKVIKKYFLTRRTPA